MLALLASSTIALNVPARWPPTASARHPSATGLESPDGQFARSQQRDPANSAYCGMYNEETTEAATAARGQTWLIHDSTVPTGALVGKASSAERPSTKGSLIEKSPDGQFARSQQRDPANSAFCGMHNVGADSTPAPSAPRKMTAGSTLALRSPDGQFARSQQRDPANRAYCGMFNEETTEAATDAAQGRTWLPQDTTVPTGTLVGKVSPTRPSTKGSLIEKSYDGHFARSQERDPADSAFCGMYKSW